MREYRATTTERRNAMSVIVIGKMKAEPATIKKLRNDRKADFQGIAKEAKAAGAMHHRWGFGDGYIVIIDEWPDGESFQKFFSSNESIPPLMEAGGVQGAPEFTIVEAATGPDEF
jgi:hypothetical protein